MSFNRLLSNRRLNGIDNAGEQVFVVYNQSMFIALRSTRVVDPGEHCNEMEKVNKNILVQQ